MHILVTNDDGPPSPKSSPYVHSLVRELQKAGHTVSVCLPHAQRSWIGKAHIIGQTVRPSYYRPPQPPTPAAGTILGAEGPESLGTVHERPHERSSLHGRNGGGNAQNGDGQAEGDVEEWVLVDGTPASCVQLGLNHLFPPTGPRGPVDLVVSGPNYGRNTTAVFALSSGTLGGALEAAVCQARSIALSYAFFTRNHDPDIIAAAGRHSVRVIEALAKRWPPAADHRRNNQVDLYSVNVPLVEGVEANKTLWTGMLQNYWGQGGSCFEEVVATEPGADGQGQDAPRLFKWAPSFGDVYKSVDEAGPGNDGWAVKEGCTSVTPLKANFLMAQTHLHQQELELDPIDSSHGQMAATLPLRTHQPTATTTTAPPATAETSQTTKDPSKDHFYALIAYEDDYVQPLILSALKKRFEGRYTLLEPESTPVDAEADAEADADADTVRHLASLVPSPATSKILQITPYERLDFEFAATHPTTARIGSYMIRKALIRKHFLSATADHWAAKRPESAFRTHTPRTEAFEVDYAEFLDDALVEAFDLRASLDRNAASGDDDNDGGKAAPGEHKEWWILKPGMSDRGQGIRLFSTMEELQGIFDGWDVESDDEDEDGDGITTSDLRHFVAQPYIHPPLLVPGTGGRKFHIRVYVVAVGAMRVYVFREMLALFAAKPYKAPWETSSAARDADGNQDGSVAPLDLDLDGHLTNTCLQQLRSGRAGDDSSTEVAVAQAFASPETTPVIPFWSPQLQLSEADKESIWEQIAETSGDAFEAAARAMMIHFQPLANGFETYGLDFVVEDTRAGSGSGDGNGAAAAYKVWLLEVNAFPDFRQTGDGGEMRGIVGRFWDGVVGLVGGEMLGEESEAAGERDVGDLVKVRDLDLGRRF